MRAGSVLRGLPFRGKENSLGQLKFSASTGTILVGSAEVMSYLYGCLMTHSATYSIVRRATIVCFCFILPHDSLNEDLVLEFP